MNLHPTRRHVLAGAGLGIVTAAGIARAGTVARPNILWFRSEDNHYSFTGAYGANPLAHTPNLDKLARDGVLFRHFYSTAPVCAPTKLAVLTGVHDASLGPGENMRATGKLPAWMRGFATQLQHAGYWCTEADLLHNGNPDHNCGLTTQQCGYDDTTGDYTKAPEGRPWFALAMTMTSHETFASPPAPGVTTGGYQPWAGTSTQVHVTDPAAVRLPAYHPDTPVMRLDRAHYMDQVTRVDIEVGQLLQQLEDSGQADNTIIIYSTDHGGVMPGSKRYCNDAGLHIPLIMRFPKRWQHLAPTAPGGTYDAPVSSVDLSATILSLAGTKPPSYMHSQAVAGRYRAHPRTYAFSNRNRMDESVDMVRTVTDGCYRYTRNYMPHLPYGQHVQFLWAVVASMREWETRYLVGECSEVQSRFWRPKPGEELYDVSRDPDQVRNLIADPMHRNKLTELRSALDQHMLNIHDNGFIPEGHPAEGWDASRRRGAYPLEQLMQLTGRAISRDPRNLTTLTKALRDRNDIVRYWAAMGLSILGTHASGAAAPLRRALTDSSPWVRVQAGDALARAGLDIGEVVARQTAFVTDATVPLSVRLHAIWSLHYLGPAATPALPALTQAAVGNGYDNTAAQYVVRTVSGTYVPSP